MNHNSIIVCFVYLDVGMDTPDKNLITLFLSYLYQLTAKGGTVKIVKREITHPTEGGTVEIVKQMQEIVGPTETTKVTKQPQ